MTRRSSSNIYRNIAWRLLPFLLVCYIFAQLTRFNLSFARQQLTDDLELDDAAFGMAASVFYVGYILFQVPVGVFLRRFGVRMTLLCIMVVWGVAASLMALARSANDVYVFRFVLGTAQGAFFPTIIFYLSCWFPDRLRGRINSLFTSALPLGSIIGGPLAGWILGAMHGHHGLRGWQWLFLLEGLPVILLGTVAFAFLADRPQSAAWLNARERRIVLAEGQGEPRDRPKSISALWRNALPPRGAWLLGSIYFGYFCALNALILWGPSLLRMSGVDNISSIGRMSGLSALIATIGMLLIGLSSDRWRERRWHVGVAGLAAAACLLLLPLASNSVATTISLLTVAGTALYGILGLFWTIPTAHLTVESRAGGLAFINMCGVCGGIVSPALVGWLKVGTGSLYNGVSVIAIVLAVSMVVLLAFVPARNPEFISETEDGREPG